MHHTGVLQASHAVLHPLITSPFCSGSARRDPRQAVTSRHLVSSRLEGACNGNTSDTVRVQKCGSVGDMSGHQHQHVPQDASHGVRTTPIPNIADVTMTATLDHFGLGIIDHTADLAIGSSRLGNCTALRIRTCPHCDISTRCLQSLPSGGQEQQQLGLDHSVNAIDNQHESAPSERLHLSQQAPRGLDGPSGTRLAAAVRARMELGRRIGHRRTARPPHTAMRIAVMEAVRLSHQHIQAANVERHNMLVAMLQEQHDTVVAGIMESQRQTMAVLKEMERQKTAAHEELMLLLERQTDRIRQKPTRAEFEEVQCALKQLGLGGASQ